MHRNKISKTKIEEKKGQKPKQMIYLRSNNAQYKINITFLTRFHPSIYLRPLIQRPGYTSSSSSGTIPKYSQASRATQSLWVERHVRNISRGRWINGEEQQLCSELLLDDRAPHPISMGALCHPAGKANFTRFYPGSCSFGHDPKFMTIGRNVD